MARDARERLLSSAVALLSRHGVAGTGVAELLAHSSVSRRSVYVHFPGGKSELVAEATRSAGSSLSAVVTDLVTEDGPAQAIRAFAGFWTAVLVDSGFSSGCPIVAATLGRADAPEAADAAGVVFGDWIDLLASHLAEQVDPETARSLATLTVAAVEGAVLLCLARRSTDPLVRTGEQLALLVDSRIAPPIFAQSCAIPGDL